MLVNKELVRPYANRQTQAMEGADHDQLFFLSDALIENNRICTEMVEKTPS